MSARPQKGDRVRIVLEGEVTASGAAGTQIARDQYIYTEGAGVKSVEILPPPVTYFEPGDVVRNKASGNVYALGRDKVVFLSGPTPSVSAGRTYRYTPTTYSSTRYEKVNVG